MEQMLRAGNLQGLSTGDVIELEGASNVYQPMDTNAAAAETHHGIRVVPTTHYNPGAGMSAASTDISGKQRGKHQLNSLLASAASLESQRLQNPTTQKMSSHRATAKRKYGW
jgi:hypothetical protein